MSDNNEQKIIIIQNKKRYFINELLKYLLRLYFKQIYIKIIDEIVIVKSGIKGPVNNEIGKIIIDEPFSFALVKVVNPDLNEFKNDELICGNSKIKILKPNWIN